MKKMETFLIITLIGIVLFRIVAIIMRMNMTTISEEKIIQMDTFLETQQPIIGYESAMSTITGHTNVAIGVKPLTYLYEVDTIVFCKKIY